jgi:hypothetical protein
MKFFDALLNDTDLPARVSGVSQVRKPENPQPLEAYPDMNSPHTNTHQQKKSVRDSSNEDAQANQQTTEGSHLSHASPINASEKAKVGCAEPSDAIQPWNPELIDHALRTGRFIRIWSRVLDGWCVWVRDEATRTMASRRYPGIPVFTLAELKALVASNCPPTHLRGIAQVRSVFGNSCSIHVERIQTEMKEKQ